MTTTFAGQWTLVGDQPVMVCISRQQILNQTAVTERELRELPDIDWDPTANVYWIVRSSKIWTWLALKGLVDETKFFGQDR
jgi:hypothetical protein